jgi:RimJ/RimL family protein N-acetyltransferase
MLSYPQVRNRELMVTLESDRLTLRMLRESDFDAYAEMCADPEGMRYIGDPLARPLLDPTEVMGKPALVCRITREEWETSNRTLRQTGPP